MLNTFLLNRHKTLEFLFVKKLFRGKDNLLSKLSLHLYRTTSNVSIKFPERFNHGYRVSMFAIGILINICLTSRKNVHKNNEFVTFAIISINHFLDFFRIHLIGLLYFQFHFISIKMII